MSATNGFNFLASQRARSSEVNQNFEWFRGHYLPVTQSGTWANTTGVYDLGSSSYKWRDIYLAGKIRGGLVLTSTASVNSTAISLTGSNVTQTVTTISMGSLSAGDLIDVMVTYFLTLGGSPQTMTFNIGRTSGTGSVQFGGFFSNATSVLSLSASSVLRQTDYLRGVVGSTGSLVLQLTASCPDVTPFGTFDSSSTSLQAWAVSGG